MNNLWKVIIWSNWLFSPGGIFIGQMRPEKVEVWILTTQYLDSIGLDIWVQILSSHMTPTNLASAKATTAPEHIQQSDIQQQKQQQVTS